LLQFQEDSQDKWIKDYFLAQIKLMINLCKEYYSTAHMAIAQLISPEFLFYCIESPDITHGHKKTFLKLLDTLYVNYFTLGPLNEAKLLCVSWEVRKAETG